MERRAAITVFSLVLLFHSTLSIKWMWGRNENLNELCSGENKTHSVVPMPVERCDLRSFIMCTKNQAIAIDQCRGDQRFNNETRWCEEADNVPMPDGCNNETKSKIPLTCGEDTKFIPINGTCKEYIHCVKGIEYKRPCPTLAYYIQELGRCEFIIEPFSRNIPLASLARCMQLDPYTKEDFGTAG